MEFFQCYVSLPEALAIPVETFVFENPETPDFEGHLFSTNPKRKARKSFFPSNFARLADLSQRKACISTFVNGRCAILLCENMRENHDFSVIIDFWRVWAQPSRYLSHFWFDAVGKQSIWFQLGLFHIEWINGFCQ